MTSSDESSDKNPSKSGSPEKNEKIYAKDVDSDSSVDSEDESLYNTKEKLVEISEDNKCNIDGSRVVNVGRAMRSFIF